MTTHYQQTLQLFRDTQDKALEFGHSAILDISEGKTIRQMSIDLCGNEKLEDKIGRWVMAAMWDVKIMGGPGQLYEDVRTWLTPSHFTVLYQIDKRYDFEYAHDLMEQCLVRNDFHTVTEAKPVDWLRGKLAGAESPTVATLRHRFWRTAAKLLLDMQSEVERLGNLATSKDKRELNIIKAVVRFFNAVETEKA